MSAGWTQDEWCRKVVAEFAEGDYVNLGFGLPLQLARFRPDDFSWQIQAENGWIGCGDVVPPEEGDLDLVNPTGQTVRLHPGASFFSSVESFAIMRGGHLDVCVLGAYQVSATGDLANWSIPGVANGGIGGAMDLVAGAKKVIVMMDHCARDGLPKIVPACTLPLTGRGCVKTIVTERAVLDVTPDGLLVRETAPGISRDALQGATGAPLRWPGDLRL